MTTEQSTTVTDDVLVEIVADFRRPAGGGPQSLIASGLYDDVVAATLAAASRNDLSDSRAAEVARRVYLLGRSRLNSHEGSVWSVRAAVYAGSYPIAGYLLGHALAQVLQADDLAGGDETLRARLVTVADLIPSPGPDSTLFRAGSDLDRHLKVCGYTDPAFVPAGKLARAAMVRGAQRLAGIGHVARAVMAGLSGRGYYPMIRETLPVVALPGT